MHAPKNHLNFVVIEESALETFLFRLTKKCPGHSTHHRKVQLVEEEAVLFCHLLVQEGLFDINDCRGCAVCAVANLEKRIMRQTKQQMEVVKKARNYYSQPEHAKFYKLCTKHHPESSTWPNSHHGQPQSQAQAQPEPQPQFTVPSQPQSRPQGVYYTEPYKYVVPYSIRPPSPPFVSLQEPAVPCVPLMHSFVGPPATYDNFIPIPYGIDPVYFMANYYEWVKYLQQPVGANQYKRMPYTKSFPLEPIEEMKTNEKL